MICSLKTKIIEVQVEKNKRNKYTCVIRGKRTKSYLWLSHHTYPRGEDHILDTQMLILSIHNWHL